MVGGVPASDHWGVRGPTAPSCSRWASRDYLGSWRSRGFVPALRAGGFGRRSEAAEPVFHGRRGGRGRQRFQSRGSGAPGSLSTLLRITQMITPTIQSRASGNRIINFEDTPPSTPSGLLPRRSRENVRLEGAFLSQMPICEVLAKVRLARREGQLAGASASLTSRPCPRNHGWSSPFRSSCRSVQSSPLVSPRRVRPHGGCRSGRERSRCTVETLLPTGAAGTGRPSGAELCSCEG